MLNWIKSIIAKVDTLAEWKAIWYSLTRSRTVVIFGGALMGVLALFYTDPSPGAGVTLSLLLGGVASFIGVALAHICRKALFDYKSADMSKLFERAGATPTGSGLALIAISIVLASFLMLFSGFARAEVHTPPYANIETQVVSGVHIDVAEYMLPTTPTLPQGAPLVVAHPLPPPKAALPLLGTVLAQQRHLWPTHPYPALLGALIEHESCITRTHSKCWNSESRLKTEKEEGIGLGQFHQSVES